MSHVRSVERPAGATLTFAERAGAWLALITLAATIVAVLVGAVLNWTGTLLALAGALIGVTAGWYAVSRRGAVRGMALAFVAVAVALLIWGLLASDYRLLIVVGIVLLGLISVGSARVALRGTRVAEHAAVHLQMVPRPQHPVLIMNLKSGGGNAPGRPRLN